jgi:hypothetical protein
MKTMFYKGPSMNPTLQAPDVLHVEPCQDGRAWPGDVIVFPDPSGGGNTVHRVVSVREDGSMETQGDNNEMIDAHVVLCSDLIGRVTHATRNGIRRVVHGRTCGRIVGRSHRFFRAVRIRLLKRLRPAYAALAGRFAYPWLAKRMRMRVVRYSRPGRISELHLLMGNRCIGRLETGQAAWYIRPPFRLMVDETRLPREVPRD